MAKRVIRDSDDARTALLGIDELFVQKGKGNAQLFFTWNQDPEVDCCPLCGSRDYKNQGKFYKRYADFILNPASRQAITIEYQFYKYRCLNTQCHRIFSKDIRFASQNENVTHRLADEIARMVIDGRSYGDIAAQFADSISRQAVGQIFNRWVHTKDASQKLQKPPEKLAILSGRTDKDAYTLFLNLDAEILVFDIPIEEAAQNLNEIKENTEESEYDYQ